MQQKTKDIQKHFEGFLKTPSLWVGKPFYTFEPFKIAQQFTAFNLAIDANLRLGKYIERFVSFQLRQDPQIEILSENIQIQREKITLGELDCILLKNKKPIHLEVIYKFYLYDPSVGTDEISHFVGPNKKDTLRSKLNKIKEKQLPLLYSKECILYLEKLPLEIDQIVQQVYFKAQLFIPYSAKNIQLHQLNSECIVGFYFHRNEISRLNTATFYIPKKKDWLVIPHTNVDWLSYSDFIDQSKDFLERQFSPLCWVKNQKGVLEKFFFVWW